MEYVTANCGNNNVYHLWIATLRDQVDIEIPASFEAVEFDKICHLLILL